ncbi:YdiK family protein [Bacillus sp. FJAT-45350]|uniref:YdiK family protein n=1 Tax=Bacillus sp. FJAT-45350 TaxID=2011014 RepID=UPI000BB75606|nr:YdiK family protein [Bacillus sp. FJAT-45350]
MRTSPTFMGVTYILIGIMFVYLAIQNVRVASWNLWTFLFIALAAIDIMVGVRFFRMRKAINEKKNK